MYRVPKTEQTKNEIYKEELWWLQVAWEENDYMELQLEKALQVRYIKLHFILAIIGNTRLPADKVSALRGGMGEMILRDNCIRDRNCAQCDFEPECIVRRTVYSKYQANPQFVTTSDSIGYLIECDNSEEDFCEGDLLEFKLILFGKTI